jgi:DNA-binding NtrC family response regulator
VAHNTKKSVLIVEDELTQSILLEGIVRREGMTPVTAENGSEGLEILNSSKGKKIDIVLLDLMMPGIDGIEVLQRLRRRFPTLPVIMLTSHSSVSTVVDAMRAGANDFIVKPASAERIRTALKAGLETASLVGEIAAMNVTLPAAGFENLVGDSPAMQRVVLLAKKAASASIPVLLEGESGVGKEVFARAIHVASERTKMPFVAVNCGAIPENLVESILFGHEKGSFTGATEKRIGKFQEANGGTLFLDEVGELPHDVQVKLLRAIQEREIDPVGGKTNIPVNIRVISATNRDLSELVTQGDFREDLYYRLNVYPITLPTLRQRSTDIPALVRYFLDRISKVEGLPKRSISVAASNALLNYHWPGNIRQLQNALFRAVILSEHDVLEPSDFPHLGEAKTSSLDTGTDSQLHPTSNNARIAYEGSIDIINADGHIHSLAQLEANIIALALDRYDGKMAEVARRLKIGRSTLYRKMEEYNLER